MVSYPNVIFVMSFRDNLFENNGIIFSNSEKNNNLNQQVNTGPLHSLNCSRLPLPHVKYNIYKYMPQKITTLDKGQWESPKVPTFVYYVNKTGQLKFIGSIHGKNPLFKASSLMLIFRRFLWLQTPSGHRCPSQKAS